MKEHKSKTINGINYNTKKAELIKTYQHIGTSKSNSYTKTLYKTKNGNYFIRVIDFLSDRIELYTEAQALHFINKTFSVI